MGYEEEVTLELEPLQGHRRLVDQSLSHAEPTGKGRGSASAGLLGPLQPTEQWLGHGALGAEGKLPSSDGLKTMGRVVNSQDWPRGKGWG